MAEKQDGRNVVPEPGCVGWNHLPTWNAYHGLLCVREINIYTLYISGVFLLEHLSFTLVNVGLFLLLVCLYLKNKSWLIFLCVSCDKHTVLKSMLAE